MVSTQSEVGLKEELLEVDFRDVRDQFNPVYVSKDEMNQERKMRFHYVTLVMPKVLSYFKNFIPFIKLDSLKASTVKEESEKKVAFEAIKVLLQQGRFFDDNLKYLIPKKERDNVGQIR